MTKFNFKRYVPNRSGFKLKTETHPMIKFNKSTAALNCAFAKEADVAGGDKAVVFYDETTKSFALCPVRGKISGALCLRYANKNSPNTDSSLQLNTKGVYQQYDIISQLARVNSTIFPLNKITLTAEKCESRELFEEFGGSSIWVADLSKNPSD